jgi:hypothetical protein
MILRPRVEESPQRSPGSCHSCGAGSQSPDREWFLDTDMDETDSPGIAIILCNVCFEILAGACGYEPIGKMARATKNRIKELEGQIDDFSHVDSTLRFFGFDLAHLTDLHLRYQQADADVLPSDGGSSDEVPKRSSKSRSREEGSSESTDDKAVGDVRPIEPAVKLSI